MQIAHVTDEDAKNPEQKGLAQDCKSEAELASEHCIFLFPDQYPLFFYLFKISNTGEGDEMGD